MFSTLLTRLLSRLISQPKPPPTPRPHPHDDHSSAPAPSSSPPSNKLPAMHLTPRRLLRQLRTFSPRAHFSTWLENEQRRVPGFFLDEYGEARFSRQRILSLALECFTGILLSLATYVSIEGAVLAFAALERLLAPLARDADEVLLRNVRGSVLLYVALCFLPWQLREAGYKAALMALCVTPLYFVVVALAPIVHLVLVYSNCVRFIDAHRSGSVRGTAAMRLVVGSVAAEGSAWALQKHVAEKWSISGSQPVDELFEGVELMRTGGSFGGGLLAVAVVALIPALTVLSYCLDVGAREEGGGGSSADSSEHTGRGSDNGDSQMAGGACDEGYLCKPKELFGLVGLLVGGAYARTARLYLECMVVFGLGLSSWTWLRARMALMGFPEAFCLCVATGVVYLVVLMGIRVIHGMYAGTLRICMELQQETPNVELRRNAGDYV